LRIVKLSNSEKVFDVGAAFGHFVKYVQENGLEAAGSDISAKAVEAGRASLGVDLHVGSLKELMLPDASVDAVVSLDAFYYVADLRAELEAMRRLVKPGGMLVLRLRNCLWARIRARAPRIRRIAKSILPAQHLWGFTPESISILLTHSGWTVVECQPAAYSMSRFFAAQSAAVWANRLARRIWQGTPILTRSFNVIAKRTN
jgi:SAM-dependent methyltransferase